jgi:predicted glycosyltransferase
MADNAVILGVTKTTTLIFDEHFPLLKKISIEPYNIRYSGTLPLGLKLVLEATRIFGVIKKEKQQLKEIINEYQIDVVISDNRFGLNNEKAECIYITHQINIQAGLFSGLANKIHHHYIKKFNAVWVPDFENESQCMAGNLSRNKDVKNVTYVGSLSRLPLLQDTPTEFDYLCLLSGPEPLRTDLENMLMEKAAHSNKRICIVRGTHSTLKAFAGKHLTVIDMPDASQLSRLISGSGRIVCRSGYSTLMDLFHLQHTNCILIPTPGQDEQIYLANYWKEKFGAKVIQQNDLTHFLFD